VVDAVCMRDCEERSQYVRLWIRVFYLSVEVLL
jgi:hypothetical protein